MNSVASRSIRFLDCTVAPIELFNLVLRDYFILDVWIILHKLLCVASVTLGLYQHRSTIIGEEGGSKNFSLRISLQLILN